MQFEAVSAAKLIMNKRCINFRKWLHAAIKPLLSYRLESKTVSNYLQVADELRVKLEWVYGIRSNDC